MRLDGASILAGLKDIVNLENSIRLIPLLLEGRFSELDKQ